MGKMSDLDLQIKELRSCGETIIGIANTAGRDVFFRDSGGYADKGRPQRKAENTRL